MKSNKIWNLLEVFIHRCIVLREENDETPDGKLNIFIFNFFSCEN